MEVRTDKQRAKQLDPYKWKPGQSGNPNGRPLGTVSLVTILKELLAANPAEGKAVVEAMVKQGKIGNMVATKEMLDRIDGKVAERHKIEGELPVRIIFVPAGQLGVGNPTSIETTQDSQIGQGDSEQVLLPMEAEA